MKTNSLGLPVKETEELVNKLNALLSNFQIYYHKLFKPNILPNPYDCTPADSQIASTYF
mgnify:CR=1 FL=1